MKLDSDDFELFGLERHFQQDPTEIDARWRRLQAEVHPDRFASEGAAAQRVAMQWSVRVNEAYQRLKNPLARAAYLCELAQVEVDAQRNTSMPAGFLMQQMEWREALSDAQTEAELLALEALVSGQRESRLQAVAHFLDKDHDAASAANEVRALMFIERFADDVQQRIEQLNN